MIGDSVNSFYLRCLNDRVLPQDLNATNIILIPKIKAPSKITEYWPIALCNVLLNIMTKAIVNRLKPLMDEVISESQSAFIPSQLIYDNVLVAYEISHYMKRKKQGKVSWASLKMDMSKAYDRVEWPFLKQMMLALGFHVILLIWLCFLFLRLLTQWFIEMFRWIIFLQARVCDRGTPLPISFSCLHKRVISSFAKEV